MDSDEFLKEAQTEWAEASKHIDALNASVSEKIAEGQSKEAAADLVKKLKISVEMIVLLIPNIPSEALMMVNAGIAALEEITR